MTWTIQTCTELGKHLDEPQITVDFTFINGFGKRPEHSTHIPREAVAEILPVMKYFDIRRGYWQVPLDEISIPLTCDFPQSLRHIQALPKRWGLVSTGNEQNRRVDKGLTGIYNLQKS